MDFFEQQDVARRKTGRLVVLMVLAVAAIVVLVYLVIAAALVVRVGFTGIDPMATGGLAAYLSAADWWNPQLFVLVAGVTVLVVAAGAFFKTAALRAGGRVVAESLGGRLIDPGTSDPTLRRVLNVVQEMAIASGTTVPPVYLLDRESGINAFAAGFTPADAVIGLTRGCADLLSRDQLQGVMAHEFSHILNGDMRISLRLIGIIHGILIIGLLGGILLRSAFYSGAGRHRRSGKQGGGVLVLAAVGAALAIIGYVGVFFGQLIKASLSRQREFLADAAAVQFTRLPGGIAGALKKIGGYTFHSKLVAANAEEASHLYFGDGLSHWFGLLATHPPLPDRIRRIEPQWDGQFSKVDVPDRVAQKASRKQRRLSPEPGARCRPSRLCTGSARRARQWMTGAI